MLAASVWLVPPSSEQGHFWDGLNRGRPYWRSLATRSAPACRGHGAFASSGRKTYEAPAQQRVGRNESLAKRMTQIDSVEFPQGTFLFFLKVAAGWVL